MAWHGSAVRVVAGELGGRRIAAPRGPGRPTSELVRAAVFNSLDARGVVLGAFVADLFAGSGALGIEALSRGAARAVFVEEDPTAVAAIRGNVTALALTDRAVIRPVSVERWAAAREDHVDLVLADPPYGWAGWEGLFSALASRPTPLVVAESDRMVSASGWEVVASKRHGGTVVTQLRHEESHAP